jgi:3-oxoacyl-[acyl-carrier protein] reductase
MVFLRVPSTAPSDDFTRDLAKSAPLGQIGTAQEFATWHTCFLASDLGSYMTGTAINVDGRSPVV